jgi:VHL beta domain
MFYVNHFSLLALVLFVPMTILSSPALAQQQHLAEQLGTSSVNDNFSTNLRFVNNSPANVNIYWLDYEGKRVFYRSLSVGEQYVQQTYLTHPWLITDINDNALYLYFPDAQDRAVEIL